MNRRGVLASLIVIVVLGGIGYWSYQQYAVPSASAEPTVSTVNRAVAITNTDLVSSEGQIVPLRYSELSFRTGGVVAEILVAERATVPAGDPLIRLEADDLETELRRAEAAVSQAEASLEAAEAELLAAQASVSTAEIGVTVAEAQLALLQADPLPQEIAVAESRVAATEADINQAAANQDVALTGAAESQIRAAEADVAAAMAEERLVQEQYDSLIRNEILGAAEEQTRIRLNAAEVNVMAAQAALNELQAGASEAEQQAATAAVSRAVAERNVARAQLDLLLAGVQSEEITVAQAQVQQAEAAVAEAETAVVQAEAAVSQASAGLAQAEATRESAQIALDQMTLTAPFAGTIAILPVELGTVVSPGMAVATLADFSGWLVETTDLTELEVVSVAVGDPVDVRVDAIPNATVTGTVTDIAALSTVSQGDVTYAVTVHLDEDSALDLPLRWGMTAFIDVDVGQ